MFPCVFQNTKLHFKELKYLMCIWLYILFTKCIWTYPALPLSFCTCIYMYVNSPATSWHNMLWEKQMIPPKIKTTVLVYSSAQTGLKIVFNEPIILVIIHRCMYYSYLYILWNHLKCHEIPIFSYAFVICKFMDS